MALFSITYDLIAEKDYNALIGRLEELDTVKVQLSQWLLNTKSNALGVKNDLARFIDDDDKLMVIEFSKKPSYTYAIKGTNAWLDRFF